MAAGFVRERVGIKPVGGTCSVPNNRKAKLMYYMSCVKSVLELDDPNIAQFTDYSNYQNLSEPATDALLKLAVAFSPNELVGKVFFQNEDLDTSNNKFFELEHVTDTIAVQGSVLVGGQRKRVAKIMMYKRLWLQDNYFNPMESYQVRLARIALGLPGWQMQHSIACAIQ